MLSAQCLSTQPARELVRDSPGERNPHICHSLLYSSEMINPAFGVIHWIGPYSQPEYLIVYQQP